ncbi:signal peptidase I [Oceanobacillus neutriphilus]|uniref:Signal peptidase I n=1 Tax=Oceanobacillus neutriphilus TaxID=531815 RepID=A0ABQ2NSU1_9BACI|nr:signal peptidase I [Oceanobacillus neutriphilus]GGP09609.1 signal peptidase I [Oceanobacillus neutriphilus]
MKKYNYIRVSIVAVLLIAVFLVVRAFLFENYVVNGKSMEPTLYDGNLMMVNTVTNNISNLHRFDVIVFHATEENDYVKRVVGLPGETIEYKDDQLYVNGEYIPEDFLQEEKENVETELLTEDFTLLEVTGEETVPEDQIFVLGDNRGDSLDSRSIGFIPVDEVVGKVDITYWPVTELFKQQR